MKKPTYCLLLGSLLSLFALTISCQSATPPQTEDIKPAFELQADMLGALHTLLLDSEGRLITRAELASDDGTVILSIDKGTRLLDGDGKPLSSILVKTEQELLPLTEDAYIVGTVYSLEPQDATFNAPLKLTLSYDAQEIPEGVREDDVYIVPYDENTGWGSYSYKGVESDKNRVTCHSLIATLKPIPPIVELFHTPPFMTGFIRKIIGDSRKTVDGMNMLAYEFRNPATTDREILVMTAHLVLAVFIGLYDLLTAIVCHTIGPARFG